ncbi:hypothetical protein CU098_002970, partial [Rhizopus stolonifer]
CGPNDPVVLYVHCSPIKPDPHVRIRRPTTTNRIPPVITVTGIKKEGRIPHIFDERPDTSVKIIVLDLRSKDDDQDSNIHSQPASKFKTMSLDFWENVLHILKAYYPNQVTESAQYIMNTAAAYNSMLTQPQPYMIHSPVLSPQPHHVQIKRKPVQYHPSYVMSPQLEQRIHRKKLPPQQKKKVRFEEVPTLYTYEAQESEEEEKDIQDEFYDEPQHYTRPSSSS